MGTPGLVVLHGQLGLGSVVRPLAAGVEGRTVIVPDVRGRGRFVCRHPELYSWPAYVDLHLPEVGSAYLDAISGAVRGEVSAAALAAFVGGL